MSSANTELASAYVQLIPSMKGSQGIIKNELNGEMSDAGSTSGDSFGKKFVSTAVKVIGALGLGKIIASAVSGGAEIEQSFGGLQTMFKDSYDTMAQYAQDAWKSAGISANDYAEQVTSFSASLLQSLGGDTVTAAEMANQAIVDMADNANKFGTNIESIQTAYQGFAKQNYTMLDNLKLGYGGTASEMMRLINDSGVLGYTLTDTSQLADVGFSTMVEAIHKVQSEMDITGTTSKEASHTISGSMNQMKASWTNLIAILTMGNKEGMEALDMSEALDAMATSISDFANNIVPALVNILTGLPSMISTIITNALPTLIEQVPILLQGLATGIMDAVPQLLALGTTILNTMANGLSQAIPNLLAEVMPMLLSWSQEILNNSSIIIESGLNLIVEFVQGLMDGLPTLIEFVPQIVSNFANIINNNMPKILETGVQIIGMVVKGLIKAIPSLVENIGNIAKAIVDVFMAINWLDLGKNIILGIKNGITSLGSSLKDAIVNIAKKAFQSVKNFFGIASPSKLMRDEIGKYIPLGMAVGIEANSDSVRQAMNDMSSLAFDSAENMLTATPISSNGTNQSNAVNYGGFNIVINAQDGQSAKAIADEVEDRIMKQIKAERKVFA